LVTAFFETVGSTTTLSCNGLMVMAFS